MKIRTDWWKRCFAVVLLSALTLCSVGTGALAAAEGQLYPQAAEADRPSLSLEFNVVQDARGKATGFVEIGLRVQTSGDKAFRSFSTALEYNTALLQPVTWELGPDASGKITAEMLVADANTIGIDESVDYPADLQAAKSDRVDSATGLGGGTPHAPAGSTEGYAYFYFSTESRSPVRLPDKTTLAVARFYDLEGKFSVKGKGDSAEVYYDGVKLASADLDRFCHFSADDVAAESDASQSAWYKAQDNEFYYVRDYNPADYDADNNTIRNQTDPACTMEMVKETVRLDTGATEEIEFPAPKTAGYKTRAVLTPGVAATDGNKNMYYSYMSNLLPEIPFELTSKESFRSSGGISTGDLATILFYDWDNTLLGTLTTTKGDARAEVNAYVEQNFIHPDLRASSHVGDASYTDSLEREYTYRGEHPSKYNNSTNTASGEAYPEGKTDGSGKSLAGEDYPLTNKLDYAFYRRPTEKVTEELSLNPTAETDKIFYWTVQSVSSLPVGEQYPYAYGWSVIKDIKKVEDFWSTFGVGELKDRSPSDALQKVMVGDQEISYNFMTSTTDQSGYFELADFSDLDSGIYYVKACYEEGESLDKANDYTITSDAPEYLRYGVYASTEKGNSYSVKFTYERIFNGRGVIRIRDPYFRIGYYPDNNGEAENYFYSSIEMTKNRDRIDVEATPAASVNRIEYVMVDAFTGTLITGGQRSESGNEIDVLDNFMYSKHPYPDHLGTEGFVYRATLNQILQLGTEAVKSGDSTEFDSTCTWRTFKDLNLRYNDNTEIEDDTFAQLTRPRVLDAIAAALEAGALVDGVAHLDWHQLQYHILHYSTNGIRLDGGGIRDVSACGGFTWCRLDDCSGTAPVTITITDLPSLLDAVAKAADASRPNYQLGAQTALDGLDMLWIAGEKEGTGLRLRSGDNGATTMAGLPKFTAMTDLQPKLTVLVTTHGTGLTWKEVQYYLLHENYEADGDIMEDLWWKTRDTKPVPQELTTYTDLLKAAASANAGNYNAWKNFSLPQLNDTFRLRKGSDGDTFTAATPEPFTNSDVSILQKALQDLVKAAGDNYMVLTWYQVQHYLQHTEYVVNDSDINRYVYNYWWQTDNKKPKLTLDDLLKTGYDAVFNSRSEEFDAIFTVDLLNSLGFRRDVNGMEPFWENDREAVYENFKNAILLNHTYGYTTMSPDGYAILTWQQVQEYLLTQKTAKADKVEDKYAWEINTLLDKPVEFTSYKDLLLAGYLTSLNSTVAWNNLSTSDLTAFKLYRLAADGAATMGDLTSFQPGDLGTEVIGKINTLALTLGRDYKQVTWYQLQHYLMTCSFETESAINLDLYWWNAHDSRPTPTVTTMAELLTLAEKAADDLFLRNWMDAQLDMTKVSALDGMRLFKNVPSTVEDITSESVVGYTADSRAEFSGLIRALVVAAKEDGKAADSLTWYQVQHYLMTSPNVYVEDNAIDKTVYWWETKNTKPSGGGEEGINKVKLMQTMISKAYDGDCSLVTSQVLNLLNFRRDTDGTLIYDEASALEAGGFMTDAVTNADWDGLADNYDDNGYPVYTWEQVQYMLMSKGGYVSSGDATSQGYSWENFEVQDVTDKAALLQTIVSTVYDGEYSALTSDNLNALNFRRDSDGTLIYDEASALEVSGFITDAVTNADWDGLADNYDDNGYPIYTWEQVQYMLISKGGYIGSEDAAVQNYTWKDVPIHSEDGLADLLSKTATLQGVDKKAILQLLGITELRQYAEYDEQTESIEDGTALTTTEKITTIDPAVGKTTVVITVTRTETTEEQTQELVIATTRVLTTVTTTIQDHTTGKVEETVETTEDITTVKAPLEPKIPLEELLSDADISDIPSIDGDTDKQTESPGETVTPDTTTGEIQADPEQELLIEPPKELPTEYPQETVEKPTEETETKAESAQPTDTPSDPQRSGECIILENTNTRGGAAQEESPPDEPPPESPPTDPPDTGQEVVADAA